MKVNRSMRALWLPPNLMSQLLKHVYEQWPQEACGFIILTNKRTVRIKPISNIASNPEHQFYMNPPEVLSTFREMEINQETLMGIYHSHPKTEAIPSASDIAQWQFPDSIALIISAKQPQPKLAAWRIDYGSVSRVPIIISEQQPTPESVPTPNFSSAQQIAIIISAILALLFFWAISITLLPAPPALPTPIG